jgi:hypothetical protein
MPINIVIIRSNTVITRQAKNPKNQILQGLTASYASGPEFAQASQCIER